MKPPLLDLFLWLAPRQSVPVLASGWEETKFQDQCGYSHRQVRTLPNMPLPCQSLDAAVWLEEYSRDVKEMVSRKIGMLIGYMLRAFILADCVAPSWLI